MTKRRQHLTPHSVMNNPGPDCVLLLRDKGVTRSALYSKAAEVRVDAALRESGGRWGWINADGYPMVGMKLLHEVVKEPNDEMIANNRKAFVIDHYDGNKLDCTERNLRFVRPCENARNSSGPKTNTGLPGITGVDLSDGAKSYEVQINRARCKKSKRFKTQAEAEAFWNKHEHKRLRADLKKYGYWPVNRGVYETVPVESHYLGVDTRGLDSASVERLRQEGYKIFSPEALTKGDV